MKTLALILGIFSAAAIHASPVYYQDVSAVANGVSSITIPFTPSSNTNAVLVVTIMDYADSIQASNVTWNGSNMTLLASQPYVVSVCFGNETWGIALGSPGGTAHNVVVTWGSSIGDESVGVYEYDSCDQSTPFPNHNYGYTTSGGVVSTLTVSYASSLIFNSVDSAGGVSGSNVPSGFTARRAYDGYLAGEGADGSPSGTGSNTFTWSNTGTTYSGWNVVEIKGLATTPTITPTASPTPTPTASGTRTPTPTITPTASPSVTPSDTPTASPSYTVTTTASPTPTVTATNWPACPNDACTLNDGHAANYGCWGMGYFWQTDAITDAIWKISTSCGVTEYNSFTRTNLPAPLCAASDGTNIWVGSYDGNSTLTEISSSGTVLGYWQLTPGGMGYGGIQDVKWDGTNIWVADSTGDSLGAYLGGGFIGRWNTTSHTIDLSATGQVNINGLSWYIDGSSHEWLTGACLGFVDQVSAATCAVNWSNSLSNDGAMYRLTNDGSYFYVADFSVPGMVNKYVASTGTIAASWQVGADLNQITYDGKGYLWSVGNDNAVNVTDLFGNRLCTYSNMGESEAILDPGSYIMTQIANYPSSSVAYVFPLANIYTPTITQTFTLTPVSTATPTLTPICTQVGQLTPGSAATWAWDTMFLKPVSITTTNQLCAVNVYVTQTAGSLMVGIYDTAGFLPHIVGTSPVQTAVLGWNQVNIQTNILPAGAYLIAVECSSNISIASSSPGVDKYLNTNWGNFPSFAKANQSYQNNSINAIFCAY